MTKEQIEAYEKEIERRMQTEVFPFTEEAASSNVMSRSFNSKNMEPLPYIRTLTDLQYPKIRFERYPEHALITGRNYYGYYTPEENLISLILGESVHGQHRLRGIEDILNTGAHEAGHFWNFAYPNVRNLSIPIDKYYGPNMDHKDIEIFRPLFAHRPGTWASTPEEAMADMYAAKWMSGSPYPITSDNPSLPDMSTFIATRFGISVDDARQMILNMSKTGYKYGGQLGGMYDISNS